MAKRSTTSTPEEVEPVFAPLVAAFAKNKDVILGKGWGAGNSVLKVKGKIFAMTVKGNLVAKLPKTRVADLVRDGAGVCFDPRGDGRLMKEWLVVEPGKADWLALAKEAHRFVRGA
jgi:hypothetical protein